MQNNPIQLAVDRHGRNHCLPTTAWWSTRSRPPPPRWVCPSPALNGSDARQYVLDTMGQSKISVFRALFGSEDLAQQANAAFERAYEQLIDEGKRRPDRTARQKRLRRLRENGIRVALTTGFSGTTQEKLLAALGWQSLADLVLAPGDGVRGRPYPDLILTALMRLEADSVFNVAALGDTTSDIESALRAGVAIAAGTLTGAHDDQPAPRRRSDPRRRFSHRHSPI